MNNFTFEIYDYTSNSFSNLTPYAVFTPKFAQILDEQLDEAEIRLVGVPKNYTHPTTGETVEIGETFAPFTICRVRLNNAPKVVLTPEQNSALSDADEGGLFVHQYLYSTIEKTRTEKSELYFIIANDRAIEKPVGSGKYNHNIYLIELTKITERYICDTITFTNCLGNEYSKIAHRLFFNVTYQNSEIPESEWVTQDVISAVQSPASVTKPFKIIMPLTFFNVILSNAGEQTLPSGGIGYGGGVFITDNNGRTIYSRYRENRNSVDTIIEYNGITNIESQTAYYSGWEQGETEINLTDAGPYTITYKVNSGVPTYYDNYVAVGIVQVVKNRLPLKKWTVTDVINRLFDLVEPLRYLGANTLEFPRFRLAGVSYDANGIRSNTYESGSTAERLEKIISPEFAFTAETVREGLQQIGGYIHAEPRITEFVTIGNGAPYFIVDFDFYGLNVFSKIKDQKPITATLGVDINQYCTTLDSTTENLTNTLSWAQGVITEPYVGGARTVRTETTTARLAEDNSTFIPTVKGIQAIGNDKNLICIYDGAEYDITAYVFEKTDYDVLSSFQGDYPFSKAYALYYTLNQPNIYGLFFKVPSAVSPIFKEYAIVNILRAVSGDNSIDLSGQEIMQLQFRVTYQPVYSARIRTHKQCVLPGLPITLAYNQSANLIESRYYSENLRGVVERLGNVEKTYTYNLTFLSQIPKIGTKFDDEYRITNVATEIYPEHIKCTVALSKRFNRKSEYVGINSQKRMWEISERNALKRESNYNTFIVLSETPSERDITLTQASAGILTQPAKNLLNANDLITSPVSAVMVTPKDINKDNINSNFEITLPVIASAFNTAMTFTFDFFDNYSAGQKLTNYEGEEVDGQDTASGFWGEYVPYTDYYGRVYWLAYTLYGGNNLVLVNGDANSLPQAEIGTLGYTALKDYVLYRKDNKEIPQVTAQITVVTNNEDVIIGSALCRNCALVNRSPIAYKLYAFKNTISALDGKINNLAEMLTSGEALEITQGVTINNSSIVLPTIQNANQYKAWALVTNLTETVIDVSSEDGKTETTQTITNGGEILIGKNNAQINGQTLYFTAKNKVNN